MHLSTQFPELFRKETYAVNLALVEDRQLTNVLSDEILAHRPIDGLWDKEYSVVPFGELEGRNEGEPIPQKNMTMGYTCYGAIANEASAKVGLSTILKERSKDFKAAGGGVDEPKFAGYLADTASRTFLTRRSQKWRKLALRIFNRGGIQAGDNFFNHRLRWNSSDVPNSGLIYDGSPLFAAPAAAHTSYASGAQIGNGASAVGTTTDYTGLVADTGGYFNAFDYPPSQWALKRVWLHFVNNMQFDENDELEEDVPDTLLVSAYNVMTWMEILKSEFIEPTTSGDTTNIRNVFMFEGYKVRLEAIPGLIRNTWFLGKAKSQGILLLDPSKEEDMWAYWRNEDDRSYWVSAEDYWGFMIRNWRRWCAGAYSTDGSTAPTFGGAAESAWKTVPAGV